MECGEKVPRKVTLDYDWIEKQTTKKFADLTKQTIYKATKEFIKEMQDGGWQLSDNTHVDIIRGTQVYSDLTSFALKIYTLNYCIYLHYNKVTKKTEELRVASDLVYFFSDLLLSIVNNLEDALTDSGLH